MNLDLEESVVVLSLLGDGLSSSLPLSDDSLGESRNTLDGGGSLGGEVLGVGLMARKKNEPREGGREEGEVSFLIH